MNLERSPVRVDEAIEESKTRIVEEAKAEEANGNTGRDPRDDRRVHEVVSNEPRLLLLLHDKSAPARSPTADENHLLVRRGIGRHFQVLPHRHSEHQI
ncbi:hypothetical protein M3Y99_00023900 [Aphelenchoides fujianensis]|nr:hypothetical protein M3Y99_00023900 [Aphelenchoides fujianensis]